VPQALRTCGTGEESHEIYTFLSMHRFDIGALRRIVYETLSLRRSSLMLKMEVDTKTPHARASNPT
jgi:hypothetical protein